MESDTQHMTPEKGIMTWGRKWTLRARNKRWPKNIQKCNISSVIRRLAGSRIGGKKPDPRSGK